MRERIRAALSQGKRHIGGLVSKPGLRSRRLPQVEVLEGRQLLATLQPISNFTIPAQQGFTQPLLANTGASDPQTFTVTSSNPAIVASIPSGPFWNIGVSYTAPPPNAGTDFTGNLVFQLFQSLTPNTVKMITQFTNDNYYVGTGKYFPRIVSNFAGTPFTVVQGGSASLTGSGNSGQPGTPFPNENLQQLPLSGVDQIAMANSGGTDSNDTQFFINTGSLNSQLGYGYTVFGQLLTGQTTLGQMAAIPVMNNTVTGEHSQPVNPLTIAFATLTNTSPDGVLLLDTTQAKAGATATIVVTATDSLDHSTTSESFTVTVGAYGGPASPTLNFRPFANPTTGNVSNNVPGQIKLNGVSGYPNTATPATLTYQQLSQPVHGTVTNFNASTGTFTYTANKGFVGTDAFQYQVTASGPLPTAPTPATTVSNPGTVSINVGVGTFQTGAVQVIGQALVITPLPRTDRGTNKIAVAQIPLSSAAGGAIIQVDVNGELDATMPAIGNLNRIIVFGGRQANNDIVIDPSVQLATTIDGGHGLVSYLTGGGGPTREHGWFGTTTLIGGAGVNQLIGLAGHVRFKPSNATNIIYAGKPHRRTALLNPVPPSGTFYKFTNGRLVPVAEVGPNTSSREPTAKLPKHHSLAKVNPGGPMKTSVNQPLKPAG